jgi:hypothetical protein
MLVVGLLLFGAGVGAHLYHDHIKTQQDALSTQISRLHQRITLLEGEQPNQRHWRALTHDHAVLLGAEPRTNDLYPTFLASNVEGVQHHVIGGSKLRFLSVNLDGWEPVAEMQKFKQFRLLLPGHLGGRTPHKRGHLNEDHVYGHRGISRPLNSCAPAQQSRTVNIVSPKPAPPTVPDQN